MKTFRSIVLGVVRRALIPEPTTRANVAVTDVSGPVNVTNVTVIVADSANLPAILAALPQNSYAPPQPQLFTEE